MLDGDMQECRLDPADFGIEQDTRGVKVDDEVTAERTLEEGMQALRGQTGPAYDSLVYGAAIALWHTGLQPSQRQAADHVRTIINNGNAKAHFEAAIQS
jgi:anthranilate phosphoribosyltransferase